MKKMVAILDDDKVFVSLLKGMLEEWCQREEQEFVVECFVTPRDLEASIKRYDLVFMDIVLPGDNGIELVEKLKRTGRFNDVIYVSAYDMNVYQVFGSQPIAYIRKTFMKNDLEIAMGLYRNHLRKNIIYIPEGKKIHCFCPDEIMYLQSNRHYIEVYMENGDKSLLRGKMDEMEQLLKDYDYIRIHMSYLVNLKYVICIDKNHIQLSNHQCCKISMKYKKRVYEKLYSRK